MARALALAERALFLSNPNPRVGCVITDDHGRVLGEGHTQQAGGAHAEVMALRDAQARGHSVRGATVWVTLEPCAHTGRTGPCCDALVAAGVGRVVASLEDPNPKVSGQGLVRLRAAGIEVQVGPGAQASRELNVGFFRRMEAGLPWVRMKVAASLDGTTALANGTSQWITHEAARADGHAWRARACAILTGIGTVIDDDPRLDVRGVDTPRQPTVVVVDSRLRLSASARLLAAQRPAWVYTAEADPQRHAPLQGRGAVVTVLANKEAKVDLGAMLRDLAQREINEVHVEAGHRLHGALLQEGLVDELLVYLAPRLLGPGRGMAAIGPLQALDHGISLSFGPVQALGPDLRLTARVLR
jgi:diaminohydroxyphosphoribosylaminopyrimidine deaminase/5-amino-6-(5-phosphoribosylamino)uracil reductase